MGKLLFIDSDDIESLSEALQGALERRGVVFKNNGSGEFDYPSSDDEEEDIDPYLGRMPRTPRRYDANGNDDNWLFQESGGVRYNSGSCGYTPSVRSYGSCGGGCGISNSYGSCSAGAHC